MSMTKREFLSKISSLVIFYRWHPEVALRYLPLVQEINKLKEGAKIVEVGSGGLGIAPYLKQKVIGVDISFQPPYHPLLKRVKASALQLPFSNSSIEVVLSVDMLEHLDALERKNAIREMMRVAKKKILLGVPCGQDALKQDLFLDKYYKDNYGRRYHFLKEQISLGLPEEGEIRDTILEAARKAGKRVKLVVKGNENLYLRLFLMKGWISQGLLASIFFRKVLLLAIPFFSLLNYEPTYRKLFFVDIINENSN